MSRPVLGAVLLPLTLMLFHQQLEGVDTTGLTASASLATTKSENRLPDEDRFPPPSTTTTTVVVTTTAVPPRPKPKVARSAAPRTTASPGGLLACINRNEGSPTYDQHDGDPYSGRYQFNQTTWDGAVSRAGHPQWVGKPPWQAPASVQDAAALQLYRERKLQPWSAKARANCAGLSP